METTAVEAKLAETPAESIDWALAQATKYQILFDRVYVAVESGESGSRESVLRDLGVGWLSVDKNNRVEERKMPEPKRRFNDEEHRRQVLRRVTLPLIFLELFENTPVS